MPGPDFPHLLRGLLMGAALVLAVVLLDWLGAQLTLRPAPPPIPILTPAGR